MSSPSRSRSRPPRPRSLHERGHRHPAARWGPDLRARVPRGTGRVVAAVRHRRPPDRRRSRPWTSPDGRRCRRPSGWHNLWDATERQDALWFLRIASRGYVSHDGSAAFFPLYPLAIRVVAWLPGVEPRRRRADRLERLVPRRADRAARAHPARVRRRGRRRLARRTVLFLAIFPTAFFFLAPYTEAPVPAARRSRRSGARGAIAGHGPPCSAPPPRSPGASAWSWRSRCCVEAVQPVASRASRPVPRIAGGGRGRARSPPVPRVVERRPRRRLGAAPRAGQLGAGADLAAHDDRPGAPLRERVRQLLADRRPGRGGRPDRGGGRDPLAPPVVSRVRGGEPAPASGEPVPRSAADVDAAVRDRGLPGVLGDRARRRAPSDPARPCSPRASPPATACWPCCSSTGTTSSEPGGLLGPALAADIGCPGPAGLLGGHVTIKVAIADDHSLVRQGLRRYLDMADGIEVVGEAVERQGAARSDRRRRRPTSRWSTSGCRRWTGSRPPARSATASPTSA